MMKKKNKIVVKIFVLLSRVVFKKIKINLYINILLKIYSQKTSKID